jgi:glutaminase
MIFQNETGSTVERARDRSMFEALLLPGESGVRVSEIERVLVESGLRKDDPRLSELHGTLGALDRNTLLGQREFHGATRSSMLVVESAIKGHFVIPEFASFRNDIKDMFAASARNREGHVADYIPKLSRVDPEQFGLSICTIDGQRMSMGDANTPFSAQCTHKPINYCLALEEHGENGVHQHIGREPSGQGFNEITLDKNCKPHNPMLNAGAIMCGALIRQDLDVPDKFDHVIDIWRRLSGGERPGFDNTTYLSERRTADRNSALTYFMSEHGAFPEGTDLIETLEFYIQCCSLEVTCDLVSVVAATLASGGLCPLTGERVLQPETVQKCLSFMYSCGMYDYSGEWAFKIGLPAKSGVSGVVMVIVPNVMGVCLWSPRLERHGNSVRAIDFCERMVERFNFHNYDNIHGGAGQKVDPRYRPLERERDLNVDLCWAASEGDVDGLKRLLVRGADVNAADYDGRTALHLAASEGRCKAVSLLLERGAQATAVDRWGNTPEDDARREAHTSVIDLLSHTGAPQMLREVGDEV